jgi:hypothetical protein
MLPLDCVLSSSQYDWIEKYVPSSDAYRNEREQQGGIRRLKTKLKRITEKRDILKCRYVLHLQPNA